MEDRWQPVRSRGVFETLLVVDGEPVALTAHLERLERSVEALYSQSLPPEVAERAGLAAGLLELGRLRMAAIPADGELEVEVEAEEIDPEIVFPSRGVSLRTQSIPGGLGPHKWISRWGINRPAPDEAGALIVDEGEALEAGWANVFAVRGGTLFTPPLDGRILPGTTRAALLELAASDDIDVHERSLRPEDLLDADEAFLTGSIRGIEAALELDGQPLAGCGPLSRRLADALRRHWGLSDSDAPRASASASIPGQLSH
ncbi:MAG TPA: aminotransferase class IV [Solirubrobacterales bacterium]|nr:aminotransferase class IV [Solirubrobacterales bacterium]